jgi:hypothetical protein
VAEEPEVEGRLACHQLGSRGTRTIPSALGTFPTSLAAWQRRLQSGQAGMGMIGAVNHFGPRALTLFADWTDRIAAGELPPAPPRPAGIERNVVITEWDWADPKAYLHDEVSTDRRNPTVNANGLIYGALELSADYLPVLDPVHNQISRVELTVRDPALRGRRPTWRSRRRIGKQTMDEPQQRPQPDVRSEGASVVSSAMRPRTIRRSAEVRAWHRRSSSPLPSHAAARDVNPATKKITHISTCFSAPPDVCRGRQRHPVDERRRRRRGG